jgi:hypothetical protein
MLYAPRGPLVDWAQPAPINAVLKNWSGWPKQQKSIFIKIDPELILGTGAPGSPKNAKPGWIAAAAGRCCARAAGAIRRAGAVSQHRLAGPEREEAGLAGAHEAENAL